MNYTPEFSLSQNDIEELERFYNKPIEKITDSDVNEWETYFRGKEEDKEIDRYRKNG